VDLYIVQVDPDALKNGKTASSQIYSIVNRATSRYGGLPVLLGTVDYAIYTRLVGLGLSVKFFPHELSSKTDAELYREAQEFAQELITELGGEADLLFKGVNILDPFFYDLTMQFRTILRIKHSVQCRSADPGVMIVLTGLQVFSADMPNVDLPVAQVFRISGRNASIRIRTVIKPLFKSFLKTTSMTPESIGKSYAEHSQDASDHPNRILFVATDTGTTSCVEPLSFVLEKLKEHADMSAFVAVDNSFTAQYLAARGFACSRYARLDTPDLEVHWSRSKRIFRAKALELLEQRGPATIWGIMISALIQNFLTLPVLSEVYYRLVWVDQVFERVRPDAAVILPAYSYLGRIAARVARSRDIPSLNFVQTIPYGAEPHPEYRLYDITDFVAAYGEEFKETLVKSGLDPRKVILVGNPKFDAIGKMSVPDDKDRLFRTLGGKPGRYIFLVTTYLFAPGTREWVRALVRQLKKLDPHTFWLVVRPHPDESSEGYERILREEGFEGAAFSKDVPLYTLLNASDVVFTSFSTVGSEAVLFDKPLICINLTDIEYSVRYDEEGVALLVKREEDILSAIESVLRDEKVKHDLERARKRFQRVYAFGLDRRSSERFVSAIKVLLAQSQRK